MGLENLFEKVNRAEEAEIDIKKDPIRRSMDRFNQLFDFREPSRDSNSNFLGEFVMPTEYDRWDDEDRVAEGRFNIGDLNGEAGKTIVLTMKKPPGRLGDGRFQVFKKVDLEKLNTRLRKEKEKGVNQKGIDIGLETSVDSDNASEVVSEPLGRIVGIYTDGRPILVNPEWISTKEESKEDVDIFLDPNSSNYEEAVILLFKVAEMKGSTKEIGERQGGWSWSEKQ